MLIVVGLIAAYILFVWKTRDRTDGPIEPPLEIKTGQFPR